MATVCKKCQSGESHNYCPNCGTPVALNRIDGSYILKEIGTVLNFDKGILYTIRELLLRPGQCIHSFIHEDRNRLVKPVIFIIVTSLIYMIAEKVFSFEQGIVETGGLQESAVGIIYGWIQSNYGYANILMAVFIAIWIKIFFRKYAYNFFEVLILLCFLMGITMLFFTLVGIVDSITNLTVLQLGSVLGLAYVSWGIGQVFDKTKKINYLKGFLSYFIGMMTFYAAAFILGFGIDWI